MELSSDKYGWFNKTNASKYLGVSLPTITKWIAKYSIPFSMVDGVIRYSKADLDRFMEEHKK